MESILESRKEKKNLGISYGKFRSIEGVELRIEQAQLIKALVKVGVETQIYIYIYISVDL